MNIYIVIDSEDESIESVYDEETFKKVYKQYVSKHSGGHYWGRYIYVKCRKVNTDNCTTPEPEDIEKLME